MIILRRSVTYTNGIIIMLLSCVTLSLRDDVTSITVITDVEDKSGTPEVVTVTLWFNFMVYQYILNDASTKILTDTTYTAYRNASPTFQVLGSTICDEYQYDNHSETKMMIEATEGTDSIRIDKVKFTTTSAIWYGIDDVCTHTHLPWKLKNPSWLLQDEECGDNKDHYAVICIDAQPDECAPTKQLLYFDTTTPNQYITNAIWKDGTNITTELTTCNPTNDPTNDPTNVPASILTDNPSFPSQQPTEYPSMLSTIFDNGLLSTVLIHELTTSTMSGIAIDSVSSPSIIFIGSICGVLLLCVFILCCIEQNKDAKKRSNAMGKCFAKVIPVSVRSQEKTIHKHKDTTHSIDECTSVSSISNPKDDDNYKTETTYDPALIHWIQRTLELPGYVDSFMQNGYNRMDMVLQIKRTKQLEDIGIIKKGHQTLIMSEIAILRHNEVKMMNHNDSDDSLPSNDSDNDVVKINMVNTFVNREDIVHISHNHQVQMNISKTPQHEVRIVERGRGVNEIQKNELMMDELIDNMKDLPLSLDGYKDMNIMDAGDVFTVEGDEEEVVINANNNKGSIDDMLQIIGEDINDLTDLGDIVSGN